MRFPLDQLTIRIRIRHGTYQRLECPMYSKQIDISLIIFVSNSSCWKWLSKPPEKSDLLDKVSKKTPLHMPWLPTWIHPIPILCIPIQGLSAIQGASPNARPFEAITVDETKLVRKCSPPTLGPDLRCVGDLTTGKPKVEGPKVLIASELLSENSPSWGNLDMAEGKTKSAAFTIYLLVAELAFHIVCVWHASPQWIAPAKLISMNHM